MKKVLFLMLAMVIGLTAANAQVRSKVAYKKGDMFKSSVSTQLPELKGRDAAPAMDFTPAEVMTRAARTNATRGSQEWETMITIYDLQSNANVGNRIAVWPDGTAAVVATWSSDDNPFSTRGTGYNYYDGSAFGDMPEARQEAVKSGWPSIAAVGDGEILASHDANNLNVYKRATKGEGDWTTVKVVNGGTWPRVASTHGGQYVHLLSAEQIATFNNEIKYLRSTDYGQTWSEPVYPPEVDVEGMYRKLISADDYVMATNGDKVAILFCSSFYDLFYIYSEDNGETWTKQIVWNYPYDHCIDWDNYTYDHTTDSIWTPDNSATIAIGNDGVVHVAFALTRVAPSEDHPNTNGSFTYWPFTDGLVYWNSEYVNENGGHEIPNYGDWSGDANLPDLAYNGTNGISSTLNDERIFALAEADGFEHLNLITPDEDHDGQLGYTTDIWNNNWGAYRTYGIVTTPALSIDENGNIMLAYSVLSESRINQTPGGLDFYLRSALVTFKDCDGLWYYDAINLSDSYAHSSDEVYPVTSYCTGEDGNFWLWYSADDQFGLTLDYSEGDDAQSVGTENSIWAVKVNTTDLFDGVNEVVNPMTNVRVYPNPATSVLNIEVNASQSSDATVSVYNIMGQKVAEQNANFITGINNASINTNELSSGVYFVTVKANGFEKTMKFVVK